MPLAFASEDVKGSFIEYASYFESDLMQGMILSYSFLQIILGYSLAAVGLHRSLLNLMPRLFQVANPARQPEALEPFESLKSREGSPSL
jgi:hypothetical protein